jgi:hypothetical protein
MEPNKNNKPKMNMPKFNMSWIYIIVIAVLIGLYMTGGTQNESSQKEAAYSKFKDMVRGGYAKKIVINRNEGELQLYIKPDSVRAIFGKGLDQLGKDPYIAVGIGSIEQLEKFIDEAREAQQFTGEYSYDNKFFLRAGYHYEHPNKGNRKYYTVGAGFKMSSICIDAGYVISVAQSNPLDQTLRFSLSFDMDGLQDILGKRRR